MKIKAYPKLTLHKGHDDLTTKASAIALEKGLILRLPGEVTEAFIPPAFVRAWGRFTTGRDGKPTKNLSFERLVPTA
ncbi:MAG: hypothetical protein ACOYB3_01250 [Azonexus sp.]